MSYLKIPLTGVALPGAQHFIIPKDNISYIVAGAAGAGGVATVDVVLKHAAFGAVGADALKITFGQAAPAAGFSLVDAVQNAWTSNPGGIVSELGGIPATLSVTAPGVVGGQALTFCTVTSVAAA